MISLNPDDGYMVLINTFTVDPSRAEELCDLLSRATDETMRNQRGFVSANLHVSLDRTHVANYTQWKSKDDYDAMFKNPEVAGHMGTAADLADSFDPIFYELRHSATPPS